MAAFLVTAAVRGLSIAAAAARAAHAVMFDIPLGLTGSQAQLVARWGRGVDGRLVRRWQRRMDFEPPG
jgi:hypothetical protein